MKISVDLKEEMETLLIPLYSRAKMTEQGGITDPIA